MIESEREDLLLHRAASGTASPEDWRELELAGAGDSSIWERLALTIRDQGQLQQIADFAAARAARVEIPNINIHNHPHTRAITASGWLTAAAVTMISLLAFFTQKPRLADGQNHTSNSEILGELPKVLVETRAPENGSGVEVIFVRQVVERARVSGVDELQQDDLGRPVKIPISFSKLTSSKLTSQAPL